MIAITYYLDVGVVDLFLFFPVCCLDHCKMKSEKGFMVKEKTFKSVHFLTILCRV